MAVYKYEAYDTQGKILKGKGKFSNEKELRDFLKKKKLLLKNFDILSKRRKKMTKDELISFTKELKIMLESGISIIKILNIQKEQYQSTLGEIIQKIENDIIGGSTIGEAFNCHSKILGEFYTNMIVLGDVSGNLSENLERISQHLELEKKITKKIREAFFYPSIVMGFTILIMTFLMIYVLPQFSQIFKESGAELPFLTRILIFISRNFHIISLGIICICLVIIFSIRKMKKNIEGRKIYDRTRMKIPIYSKIIKKNINIQLAKNLSLMLASGMMITDILGLIKKSFNNVLIEIEIENIKDMVTEGIKISEAMATLSIFPQNYCQMLVIGEESGELIKIFDRIALLGQEELETYINRMLILIEPLLIAVLGGILSIVIIGIYLPIFNMSELIG